MNKCHFLGNLTRDPELKHLPSGSQVVSFGIAINDKCKKDGEWVKKTLFLDCSAWGGTGEAIANYVKKGQALIVHGKMVQDEWDDKTTGEKRTKMKLMVTEFDFVNSGKKKDDSGDNGGPAATTQTGKNDDVGADDGSQIPF